MALPYTVLPILLLYYILYMVEICSCDTIGGVALHSIERTTALFVPHLPVIVIIAMIKYILQLGQIHFATWTEIFFNTSDKYIFQFGQMYFSNLGKYIFQF